MTDLATESRVPVSLLVTALFVLVATVGGWMVGDASTGATREITAHGLTLEVPEAWGLLEASDSEVVLTLNGLPGGRHTIVLYLPGSVEAGEDGVDHFLGVNGRSLSHLATESVDDVTATFRYVRLDSSGGPDAIMSGRFVRFDGMAAVVFAPEHDFEGSSRVLDGLIASLGGERP